MILLSTILIILGMLLVSNIWVSILIHFKEIENMATVKELMEALKVQVAETIGIEKSTQVYIQGIKQQLQDLIDNGAKPEELQAMVDELDVSEKEMAAAIAVNP